ncbi:MAG TPA: hypothetical protein PLT09_09725 [Deltaproteobacteria bacterium]|nr:hypothetical protein [Deltaproteobacteria bacterium]HPR55821.1 hypothetical protein [Deltaproteobacteria bacterium]HXK47710.1 hypothetical protein [Deltaproteobacteria bacterium]
MYNIIIEEDITFTALHCILDDLIGQGAFDTTEDCGELYRVEYEEARYTIGVDGVDVIIALK